jgi:hypothetical protein
MRLSDDEIKRHREYYEATGYPVCPRDYLDTIEALQQETERLRTVFKKAREALELIYEKHSDVTINQHKYPNTYLLCKETLAEIDKMIGKAKDGVINSV